LGSEKVLGYTSRRRKKKSEKEFIDVRKVRNIVIEQSEAKHKRNAKNFEKQTLPSTDPKKNKQNFFAKISPNSKLAAVKTLAYQIAAF